MRILVVHEAIVPIGVQTRNAAISFAAMNASALATLTDRQTRDKPSCGDGLSMSDGALFDISYKGSGRRPGMREERYR